jgi:hypothetical protein
MGVAEYDLATTTTWAYIEDTDGSIEKMTVERDFRTISETHYEDMITTHHTDSAGIKTTIITDALGRMVSEAVVLPDGSGYLPPDRITTYVYSGVTTTTKRWIGALAHDEQSTVDLAGRTISRPMRGALRRSGITRTAGGRRSPNIPASWRTRPRTTSTDGPSRSPEIRWSANITPTRHRAPRRG